MMLLFVSINMHDTVRGIYINIKMCQLHLLSICPSVEGHQPFFSWLKLNVAIYVPLLCWQV